MRARPNRWRALEGRGVLDRLLPASPRRLSNNTVRRPAQPGSTTESLRPAAPASVALGRSYLLPADRLRRRHREYGANGGGCRERLRLLTQFAHVEPMLRLITQGLLTF
jgi:hypothetical protein